MGNSPMSRAEIPTLQAGISFAREANIQPRTGKTAARARNPATHGKAVGGDRPRGFPLFPMYLRWIRLRLRVNVNPEALLGAKLDVARHVEIAPESWGVP